MNNSISVLVIYNKYISFVLEYRETKMPLDKQLCEEHGLAKAIVLIKKENLSIFSNMFI